MPHSAPAAVDAVRRTVELDLPPGSRALDSVPVSVSGASAGVDEADGPTAVTPVASATGEAIALEFAPTAPPAEGGRVRVRCELATTLDVSPGELWPLLTTADGLGSWYGPVGGALEQGGEYMTVSGAHGRVLEAEEPHRLRLTWEYGDQRDELVIAMDPEDDGGTRLTLAQTSLMAREVLDRFGPGATAIGWDVALLGLVARTDGWQTLGIEAAPPDPAWLAGPDGAALVQAWAIRWAAAAVAAGLDTETARRGEIETARAYGAPIEGDIEAAV